MKIESQLNCLRINAFSFNKFINEYLWYLILFACLFINVKSIKGQTCAGSPPTVISYDVTGYDALGAYGNAGNTNNIICGFPPFANIVGLEWTNFAYNTIGETWCNEVELDIDTSVIIYVFTGGNWPGGCGPWAGGSPTALQDVGLNFPTDAAGCVSTQSYLTWTGSPNIGAEFTSGIVTLTGCPQGIALPIKLKYFEAKKEQRFNLISWETASEINNDVQIIERSADGNEDWIEVQKVKSSNKKEGDKYSVVDTKPLGLSYYRLKSIDFDGQIEYSEVVDVLRKDLLNNKIKSLFVESNDLRLEYISSEENELSISIIDMTGRIIKEESQAVIEGINYFNIDISSLSNGMFILNINGGDFHESRRVIKN